MSAPFVTQLRSRAEPVTVGMPGAEAITVRVEMPEVWDTIKMVSSPNEPIVSLKVAAIEALFPVGEFHDDFVLKLRGFEVLDENATLSQIGAVDGSILLLTHRRRRPVR